MIGKSISHYKIIEKLGEGGMGVVYKAEDTKLKRTVALKFLAPDLSRDNEAKERFIHEAQAASALEHNNICNIHEIDESDDGQLFIVMALYEGETLQQKVEGVPLGIVEAVDIAIQIAEGLSAAHEADITHRDIKPANIMMPKRGGVKILDFGLAKLRGRTKLTKADTTLGTAAYMSPEQARGEEVEARTDIFSLGVLLYEMLTGQQPFQGDYESAVLYSILHEDPQPITALRTGVPLELERHIFKCLEKAPEERYQSATELLVDLKKLSKRLVASQSASVIATAEAAKWKGLSPLAAAALGGLVVILAALAYFALRPKDTVPRLSNPRQITSAQGHEEYPTWSPSGDRLAYHSSQSGNSDIWVTQLTGGPPVNLTAEHLGGDAVPNWSPDGSQIAFWSAREGGGVFVMPALGGVPLKIASAAPSSVGYSEWSRDGKKLACSVVDTAGAFVEIISLSTWSSRRLPLPGNQQDRVDLSWSPDEKAFAYREAFTWRAPLGPLWVLRLADGSRVAVADSASNALSPSWSADGRFLYYVSRGDLWQQRLRSDFTPQGAAQRVTTGVGMSSAAFSRDGTKIAYSKAQFVSNLWSVPLPAIQESPVTWADARQVTHDQADVSYVDVSPDGGRLLFSSDRSGNQDVWMMSLADGAMQPLTTHPEIDFNPMWSPDGKEIVFHSGRSGNRDIWVMPVGGGRARQVTHHQASDMRAAWSPDGQEIAFASNRSGNFDIWIIPARGGTARQVTSHPSSDQQPQWSPDAKWLVFTSQRESDFWRLWRVAAQGCDPLLLTKDRSGYHPLWSRNGKQVYFIRSIEGTIWELSVEEGHERQVVDLKGQRGHLRGDALATDGKQLFFSWSERMGDIWVMDVEKEE